MSTATDTPSLIFTLSDSDDSFFSFSPWSFDKDDAWSWLGIIQFENQGRTQMDLSPAKKSIHGQQRGQLVAPKLTCRKGYQSIRLRNEYSGRRY